MRKVLIDLTGQKFGNLEVLRRGEDYVSRKGKRRDPRWVCRCDCGNEILTRASDLSAKKSTKCRKCCKGIHGQAKIKTPEYRTWTGMRYRCRKEGSQIYINAMVDVVLEFAIGGIRLLKTFS